MVTGIGSAVRLAGLVDDDRVVTVVNSHKSTMPYSERFNKHRRCEFPMTFKRSHPTNPEVGVDVCVTLDRATDVMTARAFGLRLWEGSGRLFEASLTITLEEELQAEEGALFAA